MAEENLESSQISKFQERARQLLASEALRAISLEGIENES
jgi:hypothetical protein